MVPILCVLYCYITAHFNLTTVRIGVLALILVILKQIYKRKIVFNFKIKLLLCHIRLDYELVKDQEELNVMVKYTNRSKLYVYLLAGRSNIINTSNSKMICEIRIFLYCYSSPLLLFYFNYFSKYFKCNPVYFRMGRYSFNITFWRS